MAIPGIDVPAHGCGPPRGVSFGSTLVSGSVVTNPCAGATVIFMTTLRGEGVVVDRAMSGNSGLYA